MMAVALGAYDYLGGTLRGHLNRPEVDEYERKEKLRNRRRTPIEETLANIGEGRGESPPQTAPPRFASAMHTDAVSGIRPPGYEERRRERIKEKYGIDINPVSADPDSA
jgi:hypothetical protein